MATNFEFIHKQLERSFNPINDLKRSQVLMRQETKNLLTQIKKGASVKDLAEPLEKMVKDFDQLASDVLSVECYVRSIKNPIQESLGRRVNSHD